jgi:CBS domain containing-hemolysin-like protein
MFNLLSLSLFLIIGSAIVSISETSIFSVNKLKVQLLAEQGNKAAIRLLKIKEKIGTTIGTLVLLANIFGIVGALFVGQMLEPLKTQFQPGSFQWFFLSYYEWIYTFFAVLFGEVIPKNAGEKFALKVALISSPLILFLSFVFKPLLYLFETISHLLIGKSNNTQTATEEEVIAMTDLGLESNSIEQDEHEIIQNVFKMNDKSAKDIMTPRVQMDALDCDKSIDAQREEIYAMGHSRLPVFGEDYDDIRGFVLLRDVLEELAKGNVKIKPDNDLLLHKICAVKEDTKVDQLLITFQKQRIHVALVVDEYGGTAGLVTLEDVLEQLVGEIVDETDTVVDLQLEKNEHQGNIEIVGEEENN